MTYSEFLKAANDIDQFYDDPRNWYDTDYEFTDEDDDDWEEDEDWY